MAVNSPLIIVKEYSKRFGPQTIHRHIDFELLPGELFGLLGGSGTGKSVFLRSLIGLETPTSGIIKLFGQDTRELSTQDWIQMRKKIAYAFQNGALFDSYSVYENLAFPVREHRDWSETEIRQKILQVLSEFHLENAIDKFPAQLSGGMQKRLGLARALMLDPQVILYDEPTAGLDPYNTKKIEHMMIQLKHKGISGILVTHDMPVAFHVCDRIGLLIEGELRFISSPKEIASHDKHPIQLFSQGLSYEQILQEASL
jgi:phospholipid/cholesterol/gamma-HCH transport system ATP-binding protein